MDTLRNIADRRPDSVAFLTHDQELGRRLTEYLRQNRLAVTEVGGSAALVSKLRTYPIDIILVDASPTGEDAFDVCRHLSISRAPPIILLTRTGDPVDRIVGLEVGADDCVGRGAESREILARIRALLRRTTINEAKEVGGDDDDLVFSGWRLSTRRNQLHAPDGSGQELAPSEFKLLKTFLDHPNEVLLRGQLRVLLGEEAGDDRLIDTRVARLRAKLGRLPGGGGSLIRTINRRGYLLDSHVQRIPCALEGAMTKMAGQIRP